MFRSARTIGLAGMLGTLLGTTLGCSGSDLIAPQAPVDARVERAYASDVAVDRARRTTVARDASDSAVSTREGDAMDRNTVERAGGGTLNTLVFGNANASLECQAEGTQLGAWNVRYHGYGCVGPERLNGRTTLYMSPTEALVGNVTHAPLAVGPSHSERLTLTARFETLHHTRANDAPNPWEVAWLVWHLQDDEHFYYFIPKPNGWELGKRDPAYPGGQRFLATGNERLFPIGQIYDVTVQQRGTLMTVFVDGEQIVQFRDRERPYRSGRVALYSEDAAIRVHDVASL